MQAVILSCPLLKGLPATGCSLEGFPNELRENGLFAIQIL